MQDKKVNHNDKWIVVATDPTISENQIRIFMLIVSKYIYDDAFLKETVYLPGKQAAEHLDIFFDDYASEIIVLDKRGLITIHNNNIDYIALN